MTKVFGCGNGETPNLVTLNFPMLCSTVRLGGGGGDDDEAEDEVQGEDKEESRDEDEGED